MGRGAAQRRKKGRGAAAARGGARRQRGEGRGGSVGRGAAAARGRARRGGSAGKGTATAWGGARRQRGEGRGDSVGRSAAAAWGGARRQRGEGRGAAAARGRARCGGRAAQRRRRHANILPAPPRPLSHQPLVLRVQHAVLPGEVGNAGGAPARVVVADAGDGVLDRHIHPARQRGVAEPVVLADHGGRERDPELQQRRRHPERQQQHGAHRGRPQHLAARLARQNGPRSHCSRAAGRQGGAGVANAIVDSARLDRALRNSWGLAAVLYLMDGARDRGIRPRKLPSHSGDGMARTMCTDGPPSIPAGLWPLCDPGCTLRGV